MEAINRATEDNLPLIQCLWAVYEDQAHKMKLWISLLTIANANLGDNSLKKLRRENVEVKKNRQALPAPPQQLALAATAHTDQSRNKGGKNSERKQTGGKGNKGGKGKKVRTQQSHPTLQSSGLSTRSWPRTRKSNIFKTRGQMICYDFQPGRCANTPCNEVHVCIGCGIYGKACSSCGCFES